MAESKFQPDSIATPASDPVPGSAPDSSSGAAVPAVESERDLFNAARRACQNASPGLYFASHQLDRPRRFAVYALHAVLRQLVQIMGPPQIDGSSSCGTEAGASTGGCGSGGCDGESVEQRRNVCFAVIDHLYQGLATGKPDLDAFVYLRQSGAGMSGDWPRGEMERVVSGLATELSTARFATWKRVRRTFDDSAGSTAMLFARLLADDSVIQTTAFEQQARAAGIAIRLMQSIAKLRADWRAGRLLLPLDDLVRAKVKLSQLPTFASDGNAQGDPHWRALMDHQAQRVADMLRGAARGLEGLADDRGKRFAAALLVFEMDRFTRLLAVGGDPFRDQMKTSTWRRVTLMRRVHRLAVDPSSVDQLMKKCRCD